VGDPRADAEVFAAVCAGDSSAFAEIVARYRPRLLRFAGQMFGDRGFADDLVQETFAAVYAARESFNPSFAFSTWIWTILLNVCRRERRRRRRIDATRAAVCDELRTIGRAGAPALAAAEQADEAAHLRSLLDRLPPAQADAIRLRFFAELPFDEIAAAMNSSVSGAKVRVRKGLDALSGYLKTNDTTIIAPACRIERESTP
jgi:RNA polymerase sigma-70 factor (ECF subfamily)